MKFTTDQALELLKEIGLQDVELVEADGDYNKETALQAIDAARTTIIKPKLRAELLDEVKGQSVRMVDAAIEKKLVSLTGIDKSELKDLTYEEKVEKALEHAKSTMGKDTEGLREEMKTMLEKHNSAVEQANKKVKETEDAWKTKWNSREIKSSLESVLKDAPILDGADRSVIAEDFQNHLSSKFYISYDEAGKLINLFNKDNPEMPALNESKTAQIQLIDEAKAFLTPRGLWQTDMRRVAPPVTGDPYKGDKQITNNSNAVDPKAAQIAASEAYATQGNP